MTCTCRDAACSRARRVEVPIRLLRVRPLESRGPVLLPRTERPILRELYIWEGARPAAARRLSPCRQDEVAQSSSFVEPVNHTCDPSSTPSSDEGSLPATRAGMQAGLCLYLSYPWHPNTGGPTVEPIHNACALWATVRFDISVL
eukprot:scaffold1637_cov410-Prasinococcus_capsulatus_cf.AAC.35